MAAATVQGNHLNLNILDQCVPQRDDPISLTKIRPCHLATLASTRRGKFIELLFVFVEAVFVAPRSEELGIAT